MIRTQLYLPKKQYEDVKLQARLSGKPAAEVIRGFINIGLTVRQNQHNSNVSLMSLAKLNIIGGPKDLASNLDKYLYGQKS